MTTQVQQRREYGSGQVVFQQGSPADHFYIVNSGELEMSVTTTKGQTVRLNHAALGASTPPPVPLGGYAAPSPAPMCNGNRCASSGSSRATSSATTRCSPSATTRR